MPMPGPMSSHFLRSLGRPSASRGYHFSGTETLRPSANSTTSVSPVTRTCFATTVSVARLEVLMPCLYQLCLMLPHEAHDPREFARRKSKVVRKADRLQPEFRGLPVACYMNVRAFTLVARKEEEAVWTTPENRWAHDPDCASFPVNPLGWFRSG
jgi:hypothetical protein